MSGHSKWHSIKHKKAAIDAKRGKVFTRIIRELTIAARLGGGDINSNPRLRTAVAAAKDVNMPAKNIDATIKKGTGELDGANYEEVTYEGYGPGGVAVLVDATTDNRNRTTAEIRHCFSKYNGSMGAVGSVAYLFSRRGEIRLDKTGLTEDQALELALDAGGDDVQEDGGDWLISTAQDKLFAAGAALQSKGITRKSLQLVYLPSVTVPVNDPAAARSLAKLYDALEDYDDTQNVHANFEIAHDILNQLS